MLEDWHTNHVVNLDILPNKLLAILKFLTYIVISRDQAVGCGQDVCDSTALEFVGGVGWVEVAQVEPFFDLVHGKKAEHDVREKEDRIVEKSNLILLRRN